MRCFLLMVAAMSSASCKDDAAAEVPRHAGGGVVADLVERPVGMDDRAFVRSLIDAEGLDVSVKGPWGEEFGMEAKSHWGRDGRQVVIYWLAGASDAPFCRIRARVAAPHAARWKALQWCGRALGKEVPQRPVSARIVPPKD